MLRMARAEPRQGKDIGDDEREVFATNARRARQAAGLTQRDVAKRTGLTQKWVSMIELAQANVGINTMAALADALSVPLHELVAPPGQS